MKNKKPSETISRAIVGEVVAPPNLPPDLLQLTEEWGGLTYEQKVIDAKKRPLEGRLCLLQRVGGVCRNAIELVREFGPLIEVCRDELSQPGRRVPVEGRPTWTEFITAAFGLSARRMQQLLASGATSGESPRSKPARPKETSGSTSSNNREQTEQMLVLAVRLARTLVEHGLGDRFPEVAEIMKIVNSKGKMRSSTPGGVTNGHHVAGPQERNRILSLPDPKPAAPVERVPEQVRAYGGFQPQPGCYVCGTGVAVCALHAPEIKALMAERRIDEVDASEILAQQFAKLRHGFPKTA